MVTLTSLNLERGPGISRKQRRLAAKKQRKADGKRSSSSNGKTSTPAQPTQEDLDGLATLYNTGRLSEVELNAERLIERFPEALTLYNILGVSRSSQGKLEDAISTYQRALKIDPDFLDAHYNMANALMTLGRTDEAAASYRQAIKLKPDYAEAHNNLGNALKQQGCPERAVDCYRQALKIKPDFTEARLNLAGTLKDLGRLKEAIANYKQAIEIKPDCIEAFISLGNALKNLGKLQEAAASYQQALNIKPDCAEAYTNLGVLFMSLGDPVEAAASHSRALELKPDLAIALINFSEALRNIDDGKTPHEYRNLIIRCLESSEIESEAVDPASKSLLKDDLKAFLADDGLDNCNIPGLDQLTGGLLTSHLRNFMITDPGLEELLTSVRQILLDEYGDERPRDIAPDGSLGILQALACQSFLNEYVWHVTEDENQKVDRLLSRIVQALQDGSEPDKHELYLLAAYRSLHTIDKIKLWALNYCEQGNNSLCRTLQRLVVNPAKEAGIASDIEQLTPIDDDISLAVQSQYEENPYPRWDSLSVGTPLPCTQQVLKDIAPNRPILEPISGTAEILIAGCGTGKQPISAALRYTNSNVLAVDLSKTSLAYAKRKADSLNVSNIKFAQADILRLGELDKQFDVIECSGVLHHMAEPETGLRVLLSLLKPGGLIRLALYSELARQNITKLRELTKDKNAEPSAQGIRNFRHSIKLVKREIYEKVATFRDFYSTSEVRDLLFHVQEHRFTIPQLQHLIEGNKLEFLGFSHLNPLITISYSKLFPEDPNCLDLENWHDFEKQSPLIFTGMYQFWCRKTA